MLINKINWMFVFCALVLLLPDNSLATTYTVCNTGCNETTIQAVFTNNDLIPDDIVEVRADTPGGSKSYYEMVAPETNDSGSSGHHVILRARAGDTIIIDGGDTRRSGLDLSGVSYFTVDGFTLSNQIGPAIYGRPSVARVGWTIQNCIINISLTNGVADLANQGIALSGINKANFYVSNVIIDNCTIRTSGRSLNEQTDGITLYFVDTVTVKNCNINLRNADDSTPYQHIDGIQMGTVKNPTVYNNLITIYRNHNSGAQGIYIEGISLAGTGINLGTWLVYNNIVYADGWGSYGIILAQKHDISIQKVYNNTVIDSYALSSGVTYYLDGNNVYFQNNIAKTARANICAAFLSAIQIAAQIDYNVYYNSGGSIAAVGNSFKSWAQWQAAGYDVHGYNKDPLLDSSYRLTYSSPAKDTGTNLSSIFTTDKTGLTRYRGYGWDIGAYEYNNPEPPRNLRIR